MEWIQDGCTCVSRNYPTASVIAICNLIDCIKIDHEFNIFLSANEMAFGDYTPGRYAWRLENVKMLPEPIPTKGHQRLWNWEPPESFGGLI